jgi:hypothetical protein
MVQTTSDQPTYVLDREALKGLLSDKLLEWSLEDDTQKTAELLRTAGQDLNANIVPDALVYGLVEGLYASWCVRYPQESNNAHAVGDASLYFDGMVKEIAKELGFTIV